MVEEHGETTGAGGSGSTVAIIMRSKDEEPYASPALQALGEQTYQDFTLYNVDSGSTDGTLDAVKKYNPKPENVVEIRPAEYIPGRVLNRMIGMTTEPIVVLLNADCVPQSAEWLERLLGPVLANDADAVTGRQIARPDAYFVVKYDLDRAYGDRNLDKKRDHFFSAAACAFKRELWEQVKFPEEGWGEDFVWAVRCREKGARFDIAVDAVVEHSHNYTLKTLYKRERGHGIVHHQVLGDRPSLLRLGLRCLKHIARDGLYALRKGRPDTIPYNIVYRITFEWSQYQGQKAGHLQQGFPNEFFRR